MPFDYESNVTAMQTVLRNANTTTASPDLSSGLTTRIRNITINDPEVIAVQWDDLPAIYLRIQNSDETFATLGNTGPTANTKFKEATYEVIGMYIRDGAHTAHSTMLLEVYRLAENLEGVFQANLTLSGTALWCNPIDTNFGAFQLGEGVRVKGFVTTVKAKYLFR